MTVIKLELTSFTSELTSDGNTYTKKYNVYFSGAWTPLDLEAAMTVGGVSLPVIGAALDTGNYASYLAASKRSNIVDVLAGLAEVEVSFKTDTATNGGFDDSYLQGLRDIATFDLVQQTRDVAFDYNGKAMLNGAGQVFSQNAQVPFTMMQITVQGLRAVKKIPPPSQWKLVNGGGVTIDGISFDAGQLWLQGANVTSVYVNGLRRYQHQWSMLAMADKHDLVVPNVGTVCRDSQNSPIKPIVIDGIKMTSPWPLSQYGQPLPSGYTAEDVYDGRLTFDITEDYSFGTFGWTF